MLHINHHEGFGNRIKNVVSALRKADMTRDNVFIEFPHKQIFNIQQPCNSYKEEIQYYNTWRLEIFDEDLSYPILNSYDKFLSVCGYGGIEYLSENTIDHQYFNIHKRLINEYKKYFNLINFSDLVLQKVNSISKEFDIPNRVGVQIRSWCDDIYRNQNLHDINLFIDAMNKTDDCFFVSADSDDILVELKNIFGDRVCCNGIGQSKNKHIKHNTSLQNYIDVAAEILLLSKCKKIIGTYQSTFCEVAWWFGGAKQEIEIPVPKIVTEYKLQNPYR